MSKLLLAVDRIALAGTGISIVVLFCRALKESSTVAEAVRVPPPSVQFARRKAVAPFNALALARCFVEKGIKPNAVKACRLVLRHFEYEPRNIG